MPAPGGARHQAGDGVRGNAAAACRPISRPSSCSIRRRVRSRAVMDGRYITEARTAAVSAVSVTAARARRTPSMLAHHRIRRAGAQPSRSDRSRASAERGPRLEPERGEHRAAIRRGRCAPRDAGCSDRRRPAREAVEAPTSIVLVTASREPVVDERVGRGRRAHLRRRRLPARSARDGHRSRRAGAAVRRLTAAGRWLKRATSSSRSGRRVRRGPHRRRARRARRGTGRGTETAVEVTIFKSLGMAVEDVAAAELTWRRAAERGLGRAVLV